MTKFRQSDPTPNTTVERRSDCELVVKRTVNGPSLLVFDAWARPELFQRWWAPKSFGVTVISFEADVRTGGTYRLEMGHHSAEKTMVFFGRYLEVAQGHRIIWTNDEGSDEGAVTTVTFDAQENLTLVIVHDLYPSKEALDEADASGSTGGWDEQLKQLDELVGILDSHSSKVSTAPKYS